MQASVPLPGDLPADAAQLTAPPGTTFEVQLDGSVVVALAPDADTNGMNDQFLCHALGAADKATWNLEPWRPDVGEMATLAARCNPT